MGRSPPSSASARIGRNIERSTHNQGARSTGPPIGMDSCAARSSNVAVGGLSPLSHALWKTIPGGGGGGDGGIVPEAMDVSARLAWRDLFVTASNARGEVQVLLHRLSGYAEPGNITAIMGPSGSGKSTLLDTLAGRLAKNTTLTGEIFLNGRKKQLSYGVAAYVTQDDTLIGTLTVRETIAFSANLRLPDRMPASKKRAIVESTIVEMGLQESADTAIGNWHLRGLSGGEKRRVSIALEILTRPRLLFLDEPTSGLDSASAFFVTQTLKNLARDGRTVIASIHQPSSEVFELFDNLCLLSQGKLIYFGNGYGAREFFADAGFPCPELRNPSDHYLRAVNADFDRVQATLRGALKLKDLEYADPLDRVSTSKVIAILVEAFQSSGYAMMMAAKVHEVSQTKGVVLQSTGSHASFFMQAATLTLRSFKNMTRDMGYYWLRLAIYVILNIGIGTLYFRIGTDYGSISARAACMSYVGGFLTFMSIGGFPSFVEDIKVFSRERLNGHYGVAAFIIGNTLSSLPFLLLIALVSGGISYNMVKLHPGVDHFFYFVLNLFASVAAVESLMMTVASLVPNFLMGIITGAGIQGVFLLVAGFFRLPDDLPKFFWKYPMSYIGFHMYSLQGMYENDFRGLEFGNKVPGLPRIPGEFVLEDVYQINMARSKWWNLGIIFLMILAYRLLFFLVIKFAENVRPGLSRVIAKSKANLLLRNNSALQTAIRPVTHSPPPKELKVAPAYTP